MKPWGRFLLVLFAYGMALLHTVVPHHHSKTSGGDPVIVHNGCVLPDGEGGLLQQVMSTDLGVGHLENFNKNSDAQVVHTPGFEAVIGLMSLFNLPVSEVTGHAGYVSGYIEKLTRSTLLSAITSFRAPPAA
jgi:hypothetical protein